MMGEWWHGEYRATQRYCGITAYVGTPERKQCLALDSECTTWRGFEAADAASISPDDYHR